MRPCILGTLPLSAFAVLAVLGMDIMDELAGEWKMGLRPRQERTTLQPFAESLGAAAEPVSATYCSQGRDADGSIDFELGQRGEAIPSERGHLCTCSPTSLSHTRRRDLKVSAMLTSGRSCSRTFSPLETACATTKRTTARKSPTAGATLRSATATNKPVSPQPGLSGEN
jgi:hypothetical protein